MLYILTPESTEMKEMALPLDITDLGDASQDAVDFRDTSFFQPPHSPDRQLPTPVEIIQQFGDKGARVICIEEIGVAVKINHAMYLRPEEAQTMRAIRRAFPRGEIPVPEVFGWRKHQGDVYMYMSIVRGQTLRRAWDTLTPEEKGSLQGELKATVQSLRRLTGLPATLIGSVTGGQIQDRFFHDYHNPGPFPDIKTFNDWLMAAATRKVPGPEGILNLNHPYLHRDLLPDIGNVYFTHGDLSIGNIIISGEPGSRKIVGIIDWEQAGWYPDYWEYCKLFLGVETDHEWRDDDWPGRIVEQNEAAFSAVTAYHMWRCPAG